LDLSFEKDLASHRMQEAEKEAERLTRGRCEVRLEVDGLKAKLEKTHLALDGRKPPSPWQGRRVAERTEPLKERCNELGLR